MAFVQREIPRTTTWELSAPRYLDKHHGTLCALVVGSRALVNPPLPLCGHSTSSSAYKLFSICAFMCQAKYFCCLEAFVEVQVGAS